MRMQQRQDTEVNLGDVVFALNAARGGIYKPLKNCFLKDYNSTSRYIAKISVVKPDIFDIKKDTIKGGFLEEIANNVLVTHPDEKFAKECLAKWLSAVRPRTFSGILEHTIDIGVYVVVSLLAIKESYAIEASHKVTHKLFDQHKEKNYRNILNIK